MEKRQILLAIVLALSIVACFLPWLKMDAAIVGEEPIKRDIYGYDYIVPLGAPYTAPVAILNAIGFILSACSFKLRQRIRMLNVAAGILLLLGVMASFGFTTNVAFADVSDKGGSFHAWGDYGMGLEALFGLIMVIIGALQKPEARPFQEKEEEMRVSETLLKELCRGDTELYFALSHTILLHPSMLHEEGINTCVEKAQELEKKKRFLSAGVNYRLAGEIALYEGKLAKVQELFKKCAELENIYPSPNPNWKKIYAYYSKKANAEKALKIAQEYYTSQLPFAKRWNED